MNNQIVIIDPDRSAVELLAAKLRSIGYGNMFIAETAQSARTLIDGNQNIDLALIAMKMPDMDGLAILDYIKNTSPGTECIMVTAINEARTAVECLKKGAYDYLVKPVAKDVLAITLPKAMERRRLLDILDMQKRQGCPTLVNPEPFAPIKTQSPVMWRLLKEAELHAASDLPILITGESGTGKELLAWAIHQASSRAEYPFAPINMASISSSLFEAQFFRPFRKGAGGSSRFLEHTNKGTLFLDEIGDLPLELQGKLLRVLQEGEFSRVGSKDRVVIDLRFIAATNEDLDAMIARQAFRKDLFYRIRSGWLRLPPLRERMDDLPLLADTFLEKHIPQAASGTRVTSRALQCMAAYAWPGNIRELKSVLHAAALLAQGNSIDSMHLPNSVRKPAKPLKRHLNGSKIPDSTTIQPMAEVEKEHILNVYYRIGKNKVRTAKALEIGLNTLRRKLASYGVK